MPTSVLNIANAFLHKARSGGSSVDPLKLQKLVYLAHGWKLALTGEPLINENFEAWRYGPVVPELYHEFREFKAGPIHRLAHATDEPLSENASSMIDQVWERYRGMSALELSALTHEPGSAWSQTYEAGSMFSRTIPNALIADEFIRRMRASGAAVA